jgi:hypothetical protein
MFDMNNIRNNIELADIFNKRSNDFITTNNLCSIQAKAYNDILNCRTSELGGHKNQCTKCNYSKQSYNSCRNRHCPKCQFVKKAQWVDQLAGNLPPVKHFHIVFTIPSCLHELFYSNQAKAYDLLFKASSKTLLQVAQNTKYLGAQAGAVSVLHTWGQSLTYHPHIHMIVPAGGFSEDQTEWISSSKKYFVPVKILSTIFRGILWRFIEKGIKENQLKISNKVNIQHLKNQCYKSNWVVYSEKPFAKPENLIQYLGNYTHRVAISNQRILKLEDEKVIFKYKDNKNGGLQRTMGLEIDVFIKRFLQHILPSGFCKIRYYGFMALRNIKKHILQCFSLLEKRGYLPVLKGLNAFEVIQNITNKDPFCCPKCNTGKMLLVASQNRITNNSE